MSKRIGRRQHERREWAKQAQKLTPRSVAGQAAQRSQARSCGLPSGWPPFSGSILISHMRAWFKQRSASSLLTYCPL
jgi:hypothetical protein